VSPAPRPSVPAGRLAAAALIALSVAGCLPSTLAGRTGSTADPARRAVSTPIVVAIRATPSPSSADLASPGAIETLPPDPTPTPRPTATPRPPKKPVDVKIVASPAKHFITEIRNTWCAASGTQMVIALNGQVALTSSAQSTIFKLGNAKYWSWSDSHNKGWGPSMIAKVLTAYHVPGYAVRVYKTRAAALLDAAKALERTRQPVLLMVWRGAHTWVMTGFRATADPLVFSDAKVTGTYVLDPWYPRISSIWGPSDPPGTFQNASEMVRNYLPWKRPEGRYPARDGQFIAVVPTLPKP
jgi:hypothetical protein